MKIISIENIRKIYHTPREEVNAVDNFSYTLNEGEILAIVGPSGCGKSTILNIISGLDKNYSGNIDYKDNITFGYMLQVDCLFPFRSIMSNCLLGLEVNKKVNKENIKKIEEMLKEYKLYEFKDKYPNVLSGGMRQRVALIRTLALNPNVLLLDEPFSALDYSTRLILSDDVYKIVKENNLSAIMVTHNIEEAVAMADTVIVLTNRPCKIKSIYEINLKNKSLPSVNRRDENFNYYSNLIWKDIDHNV